MDGAGDIPVDQEAAMFTRKQKTPPPIRIGPRHYSLEIAADTFERAMRYDSAQALAMTTAIPLSAGTMLAGVANYFGQLGFDAVVLGLTFATLGLFAIALVRTHKRAEMLEETMFQGAVDSLHRREAHTLGAFERIRRLAVRS